MKRKPISALLFLLSVVAGCRKENTDIQTTAAVTDGQILVAPYSATLTNPGKLMSLDQNGNVLWQKTTPAAAINFKKWVVGGQVRYSYMEFDPNAVRLSQGILPTTAVVLDENYQEIKRVRLLPFNGRSASDESAVDAHEFIYLGDNHFIVLSYFQETVNNIPSSLNPVTDCKVVAPIIQEIQNDQVVWEWDGTKFPELYTQSVEGNAFSNGNVLHDYVHMNSIYVDPTDDNLICSMRNLNQIIKINRHSGDIVWRLGGTNSDFPVTADMKFLRQHYATLTDNNQTLLLFDNGEANERPYTRVDEFSLDVASKTVKSFKSFTLPEGIFSQYMGSVEKRGDTYFIGCGSIAKAMEVNYNTGNVTFEMKLDNVSYRALKY